MKTTIKMLTEGLRIVGIEAEYELHCQQKGYAIVSDGAAETYNYKEYDYSHNYDLGFNFHGSHWAAAVPSFVYYKKWADGNIIGENQEVLYVQPGKYTISESYELLKRIREYLAKDNRNYLGRNSYEYLSAKEFQK